MKIRAVDVCTAEQGEPFAARGATSVAGGWAEWARTSDVLRGEPALRHGGYRAYEVKYDDMPRGITALTPELLAVCASALELLTPADCLLPPPDGPKLIGTVATTVAGALVSPDARPRH